MQTWTQMQQERPRDDEKRMIVTLVRRLARATGEKQEAVYQAALANVERMRRSET